MSNVVDIRIQSRDESAPGFKSADSSEVARLHPRRGNEEARHVHCWRLVRRLPVSRSPGSLGRRSSRLAT